MWTKKERTRNACRIKNAAAFERVWYSLPVGIRRSADGLTLSVLVDAVYASWLRERAMVTHDLRVPMPSAVTKLEVAS